MPSVEGAHIRKVCRCQVWQHWFYVFKPIFVWKRSVCLIKLKIWILFSVLSKAWVMCAPPLTSCKCFLPWVPGRLGWVNIRVVQSGEHSVGTTRLSIVAPCIRWCLGGCLPAVLAAVVSLPVRDKESQYGPTLFWVALKLHRSVFCVTSHHVDKTLFSGCVCTGVDLCVHPVTHYHLCQ